MSIPSPERLLRQYQRLVELSLNLASTLELNTLLKNIMDVAVELVEAEEASILLYDQLSRRLYFETATNMDRSPSLQRLSVPEESIAGWVALNRQPQIVNNVRQDERHFESIDQQTNFRTRSIIAVPLLNKQKLIGVLEVLNKKQGLLFDLVDQQVLQALAAQAAIAIENSRLFQQSDMISELVHEIRTPLTSISTASYLLQRPDLSPEQRQSLANTISGETQRLNELATIFLDLTRLKSGRVTLRLARFNPRELLEECCNITRLKAGEKEITVHLEAPPELPELEADHDKIKQLLLNLLNNAVKYNHPNGHVWLRAGVQDNSLVIEVQDSGVGIPPDQLSQLFTRFFRARNVERSIPGTGLGLSIAHRIVEMHGGQVFVDSALNEGTTFQVRLPLPQAGGARQE